MCGIIGIWAKNKTGQSYVNKIDEAVQYLKHRGPDFQSVIKDENFAFGHARLSIIDLSSSANQPFSRDQGEHILCFNGEIYNYQNLRKELIKNGVQFDTESDTEVLFQLLKNEGENALDKLNGFFAFSFYDKIKNELLLARDRLGIKPLYLYENDTVYIWSSEVKPIISIINRIEKEINHLDDYLSYTYLRSPLTILKGLKKVLPGERIILRSNKKESKIYYQNRLKDSLIIDFKEAQNKLVEILSESVKLRLIADVPVGCFLSGGVDSSIIASIAKKFKENIHTFSIGFDHPYFNEAGYASQVAKHINSQHHEFILTRKDFKANFYQFLDAIDEPFGDSSAFAVFLLSQRTKDFVKVALSGDGADELFGGYQKHLAELKIRELGGPKASLIKLSNAFTPFIKDSRDSKIGNFKRKLKKLSKGLELSLEERYDSWCRFVDQDTVSELLLQPEKTALQLLEVNSMNELLLADQRTVLEGDMLKKVDMMSMAHALEVRTPFLDHRVVAFANSLPLNYKIQTSGGKRILKEAFKDQLPSVIFERSKKGFEIPLREWLSDELEEIINGPLFKNEFIREQGIFKFESVNQLIKQWNRKDFGDKIYLVWSLIIFQYWWNKNIKDA